ncbi:MAG: saccharopine dehydrogenase C-terminal domain-containing protein [Gammaproteobacteria bacterium]
MFEVLIAGAGKIGALITCLLAESGDYKVHIADLNFKGADIKRLKERFPQIETVELDVKNKAELNQFLTQHPKQAIISSLPYFCNPYVAEVAKERGVHYFDLTEDVEVTRTVKGLAQNANSAFVPQCGLAPGFISIVANSLMQHFDEIDAVKLRVGALPQNTNNALQYSLTWSTDGVINEYGNLCHGIKNREPAVLNPLEDLEHIQLDGLSYEAFNTSGGLGSLAELYEGKVNVMNYKTIRYPGHCEKMRVLMNDLKLNDDRETLKRILENAIPKTYQDLVLVYVSVTGYRHGNYLEENYMKKVYPHDIAGLHWSAIQTTTAAGICAVVDMVLNDIGKYKGFVYQEQFSLEAFLSNRFGRFYQ